MSRTLDNKTSELLASESGTVRKEPGGRLRVCLVYPNTYPLAMANLGFQSAYAMFNAPGGCVAERAFLPDSEAMAEHERTGARLGSLESNTPLSEFDVVAFSVPFENDYANIPRMLVMAGIEPRSSARAERAPLVVAGGVAVSINPEPVADLIDLFFIGEGEGMAAAMLEIIDNHRTFGEGGRAGLLRAFDALSYVYVPSFYEPVYEDGAQTGLRPLEGAKPVVRAAKGFSLDCSAMPESLVTTPLGGFGDTYLVEVERGCGRGCRFCAAGFLYMPPRWRNVEDVKAAVKRGVERTGKVGLVGTAVSEYPWIREVLEYGVELGGTITLSSLRLDVLTPDLLELLKSAGYRTMTIAPEAGSERLRAVVNKGMTDAEIISATEMIAEAGFKRVKLYFLIGLPTETDEDAEAIVTLTRRVAEITGGGMVSVSINPFIPKPFTPFQWHGFAGVKDVERRYRLIKKGLSGVGGVRLNAVSVKEAFAQAWLARADRRAVGVVLEAAEVGLRRAIKKLAPDATESVERERTRDEFLPWDVIDHGLKKDYLWREYKRGLDGGLTSPCVVGTCKRCGVCTPEFLES